MSIVGVDADDLQRAQLSVVTNGPCQFADLLDATTRAVIADVDVALPLLLVLLLVPCVYSLYTLSILSLYSLYIAVYDIHIYL